MEIIQAYVNTREVSEGKAESLGGKLGFLPP